MAKWQPPIPAGALYSKPARILGPALALLAYCYDKVSSDGWFTLSLKAEATDDLDEAYPTIKRWWQSLEAGPFFAEVQKHGRNGMRVRFKDGWLDWRILAARGKTDPFGTDTGSEMIPNTPLEITNGIAVAPQTGSEVIPNTPNGIINGIINGTDTGSEMIPQQNVYGTHDSDQATSVGAQSAPAAAAQKPSPKRGARDPNQQHPACQLFFERTGYRPNRQQATEIAGAVRDLEQWQTAMAAWLGRGHRINDAAGMLDWYLHPERMARSQTRGGMHGSSARPIRQSAQPARERAIWTEASLDDVV